MIAAAAEPLRDPDALIGRQTQPRADVTVAHYVTDGKVAFVAYARLVGTTPAEQLIDETVSLFRTAHLGIPEVPAPAPASAGQP